jgi:hypothetical protein
VRILGGMVERMRRGGVSPPHSLAYEMIMFELIYPN